MAVKIRPVSDLRRNTREVIETAIREDNVVYITQHGRPTVVLMDYERYEALMSHEIDDGARTVTIVRVKHRRDVYR